MAILYITEYAGLMPSPVGGQGQVPMEPPLAEQAITFTASSTPSSAFNAKTRLVRLHTDTNGFFVIGINPTAVTSSSGRMAANQTEYRGVPMTGTYKVAGIT